MKLLSEVSAVGLVAWLADFYLLATLLMLVALAARRRIRQPAQRLTVNWVVAVELAALAVVCTLPFWPRIPLLAAHTEKPAVETPVAADPTPTPAAMPRTTLPRMPKTAPAFDVSPIRDVAESTAPPVSPPSHWSRMELAAAAYLASAGLVIAWLVWGAVAATRACRNAENAPESLREELARIVGDGRVPRLLVSSRVTTAVALGLRRPTIVLPAGLLARGSAAGAPRGPDARMGPYPQRRFAAPGPGAMPARAALRPSAFLVAAEGDPRRPGVAGRRRRGGRRPAGLCRRVAPLGSQDRLAVAARRFRGRNLGEFVPTFKENCHAFGREFSSRA